MVAEMQKTPARVGRPRKIDSGSVKYNVQLPPTLHEAVEKHQHNRGFPDRGVALRDLLWEAAELRKLVAPRPR